MGQSSCGNSARAVTACGRIEEGGTIEQLLPMDPCPQHLFPYHSRHTRRTEFIYLLIFCLLASVCLGTMQLWVFYGMCISLLMGGYLVFYYYYYYYQL